MPRPPDTSTLARGSEAERIAQRHLEARGLSLLDRNARYRFGELDLVMHDAGTVAFVEVRLRKPGAFADGLQSVDARKRRRLRLAATAWLSGHRRWANAPCRFDIVAVDAADQVTWCRDAFRDD